MKKRLLLTLRAAHGSAGAARLLPLSFALPEELGQWEAAVREQEQARGAGGGVPELWMVKTGQDAGAWVKRPRTVVQGHGKAGRGGAKRPALGWL